MPCKMQHLAGGFECLFHGCCAECKTPGGAAEEDLKHMRMDIHEVDGAAVVSFSVPHPSGEDAGPSDSPPEPVHDRDDSDVGDIPSFNPLQRLYERMAGGEFHTSDAAPDESASGEASSQDAAEGPSLVFEDGSILATDSVYVLGEEEEADKVERIKASLVQIDRNRWGPAPGGAPVMEGRMLLTFYCGPHAFTCMVLACLIHWMDPSHFRCAVSCHVMPQGLHLHASMSPADDVQSGNLIMAGATSIWPKTMHGCTVRYDASSRANSYDFGRTFSCFGRLWTQDIGSHYESRVFVTHCACELQIRDQCVGGGPAARGRQRAFLGPTVCASRLRRPAGWHAPPSGAGQA